MTTTDLEKELQSTLLRISIICATSIQSLREHADPTILPADATQLPPLAAQLSEQIIGDIKQLLTLAQKHTTALSLALRPSSSSSASVNGSSNHDDGIFSPVSGLDRDSLDAAKSQIQALGTDVIPKMVFLAKKAYKDRAVYQLDPQLAAAQKAERARLEQVAKEAGAQLLSGQDLGMGQDTSAARKLVAHSLGNAFAREVRAAIEDVLATTAELLHSFLDSRTRAVLHNAQNARDKRDGIPQAASSTLANDDASAPKSVKEARQKSLELNNRVWEACTKYIGQRAADGSPTTLVSVGPSGNRIKVQVKGLSRDNLEASKKTWKERVEIMRDGLDEMKLASEEPGPSAEPATAATTDEPTLGEMLSAPQDLSTDERKRLSQLANLVKMGNTLHENVLKAIITNAASSAKDAPQSIDYDHFDELAQQLEEAQDELVAAALYGEVDAGLEDDDDEDEAEDEEEGESMDAVVDAAVQRAIMRTLHQYTRAAVALSAYVTGNETVLDRVKELSRARLATNGDFAQTFESQFNQLSKLLTEASSTCAVRSQSAPKANGSAAAATAAAATTPVVKSVVPAQAIHEFKTEVFVQELENIAQQLGGKAKVTDRAVAEQLDRNDPLASMREGYILPTMADVCEASALGAAGTENAADAPSLYMCGNSLGPLSKLSKQLLTEEMDAWGRKAVLGHFEHPYERPWTQMEMRVNELMADMVGARRSEVAVMGTLTGNLHVMLATFYRPSVKPYGVGFEGSPEEAEKQGLKKRHKIVYELKAFPSDKYALDSVIELNGYDPATSLVALTPREGRKTLETADILTQLEELGREGETALVLLGGLQYFTGQLFELELLAAKAHEHGILFGVDMAHGFANVPMRLHDWGVDFGVWCTYKYGSSGPGGIAGVFVHERWTQGADLTRPAGWWGHDRATRFSMPEKFKPIVGADGWQASNPSMLDITALRGSLETLNKAAQLVSPPCGTSTEGQVGAGRIMPALRSKSLRLTAYLETLLLSPGFLPDGLGMEIVTPRDPHQRGSQLCIRIPDKRPAQAAAEASKKSGDGAVPPPIDSSRLIARAHRRAEKRYGLVADIRHPDMLRIAPLAQYSTFTEVWRTAEALRRGVLEELELEA